MVYHDMASYLWVKGQTYYFNRRVPKDVQAHYKASRIVICLKTSRKDQAIRAAGSIAQRLEDQKDGLTFVRKMVLPASRSALL